MSKVLDAPTTGTPGLDEPCFAHMPEGKLYMGGDMLLALCGARLVGVPAVPEAPHCPVCEQEIEAAFRNMT